MASASAAAAAQAEAADSAAPEAPPLDVRWTAPIRSGATAPPLAAGGRLYVATGRQDVKAFTRSGTELWSRQLARGFQAPPVLVEGVLVVAAPHPDAEAHGLDPATGESRWNRVVGDIVQAPLVGDGRVLFLSLNGRLTSLDPRSGEVHWETRVEGLYAGPASAVLDGNDLHTLSGEGLLVHFDAVDGRRQESHRLDAPAAALLRSPAGSLLVVLYDGRVLTFDRSLAAADGDFPTAPVVHAPTGAGERLFVPGSDRILRAFSLGGEGLWSRTFSVAFAGPAAPSPDATRIAIGDLAGTLWTLDAATGGILSRTPTPGGALVASWSTEALAAVTEEGMLLVLDDPPTAPPGAAAGGS